MGDVHAEHALQGLMDPTVSWGRLGAHLVAANGARGARVAGGVTVVSLSAGPAPCLVMFSNAGTLVRAQLPPSASRDLQRLHCTALEPASWAEWSLRDVGLLDGAALSLALGSAYLLSSTQPDTASDAAVREAEQRVADSVRNSPCNGPSIEAIEALEAADQATAATRSSSSDPNELPGLFAQLRRRDRAPPRMLARDHLPGDRGNPSSIEARQALDEDEAARQEARAKDVTVRNAVVVVAVLFLTAVDAMGVWFFLDSQQQAETLQ